MPEKIDKFFANIKNGETIILPSGEFEGNFVINKPCVVTGTNTTLWSKTASALSITADGVKIKNLRIEAHGGNADEDICLSCASTSFEAENIEIFGGVDGVDGESDFWDLPRILNIGKFPSEKKSIFLVHLYVPVNANISHSIKGLEITPTSLNAGHNVLSIKTDCLKNGTYIYGDIFIGSKFTRRISINGSALDGMTGFVDSSVIYKSNKTPTVTKNKVIVPTDSIELQRGERVNARPILGDDICVCFEYESVVGDIDIEAYAFLLNKNEKADGDNNLIFFGNELSKCGGVQYNVDKTITINLSKIDVNVSKIAISHSIYGDNPNHNFSKVKKPIIKILSDGKVKTHFYPVNLFVETTIVSVEFYRYKDTWKLSAVGHGYREGLKRLCESYGLVVI